MRVCDMLSTFLSKTWSRTCCINLDVRSSLGFKQVCSWLSTCFRYAFDVLATCFRHAHASRKPGLQPGLQLDRIMECGLYATDLSLRAFKCCSVVFGVTLKLHVINICRPFPPSTNIAAYYQRSLTTCVMWSVGVVFITPGR